MKKILAILIFVVLLLFNLVFIDEKAQAGFLDIFYKTRQALTISGNKVLLSGEPILLRGVAVGNPYIRQASSRRTSQDYEVIKKDWRANTVRLSIHPGTYRGNEKKVKKILEEEIKEARRNDLFVIVDWHVIGRPNGWYKILDNPWVSHDYYSSNFNTAKNFWKYMAVKYRSDRGVIFELWNEPKDKDRMDWPDIKPYMQSLHDLIRSNGAQNIIIAPGVKWTYDLRGIKRNSLLGENISYAWHNYPGNDSYMGLDWDEAIDKLNEDYPIFVTEWGFSKEAAHKDYHFYSQDDSFSKNFKSYLLNKNLHFTAWAWHGTWTPNMFKSNWLDLTDYGRFVKFFLADIDSGSAFLKLGDNEINSLAPEAQERIINFIKYGVDENSIKLGAGERRAVIFSYQEAFGALPASEEDMEDIRKIANGRWPEKRSQLAENRAREQFRFIYKRWSDMNNSRDNAAITVMAYGLRQRAENRNLDSERQGIRTFKNIYGRNPASTEEWNILQAITYSGAER